MGQSSLVGHLRFFETIDNDEFGITWSVNGLLMIYRSIDSLSRLINTYIYAFFPYVVRFSSFFQMLEKWLVASTICFGFFFFSCGCNLISVSFFVQVTVNVCFYPNTWGFSLYCTSCKWLIFFCRHQGFFLLKGTVKAWALFFLNVHI